MKQIETLPLWKKLIYGAGTFGWALTSFAVINLSIYFYMPPESETESVFPILIFQGGIIGVMTIIGLSTFFGRIFDGITYPIIAGMTDRSKSKLGRRTIFLLLSGLPFAVLSVLVFFPPTSGLSTINSVWLVVTMLFFYLFMTMYVVPFQALLPELGHSSKERLDLNTFSSFAWALAFGVGQGVYPLQSSLEKAGYSSLSSFRIIVIAFAVIGFISMMLPVIFINEKKYCGEKVSTEGTFQSLKSAFRNRNFVIFTLSDLAYWVANTFLEIGIVYYVTVLLGLPKELTFTLMAMMFVLSFLLYAPVNLMAKKIGKKKTLILGFFFNALIFLMVPFLGVIECIPVMVQGLTIILLSAVPVAIFGIIPGVMVADIATADAIKTGNHKEAIYLAARTFTMKQGIAITNFIFPSLLLLGRSVENPTGVRLTGLVAFAFTVFGLILLFRYNEKEVNTLLEQEEEGGDNTYTGVLCPELS